MISPGQFHKRIPKDPCKNLQVRRRILQLCKEKPEYRAAVLEACRLDILFFLNLFGWQYNPKKSGSEIGPFITWDFQDDALLKTIRWMFDQGDDVLWEKSRELGATWLALFIDDWMALFHGWKKFLCISHTEEAVDRPGDPDSLFWKIDFMHRHMPDWMTRGAAKRKLGFSYPATHSSINGAATTERSGVGGRATGLTLDEFSKHRDDYAILGQTADTGPRLFIGTHYGTGGAFFDLTKRPDLKKIVMHWSQHPEKSRGLYRSGAGQFGYETLDKSFKFPEDYRFVLDGSPTGGPFPGLRSPWYDRECIRRANSRDVAMHLDIDPQGSQSQVYDRFLIQRLKEQTCPPYWEGELSYDKDTAEPFKLISKAGGPLKLWCHVRDGKIPPGVYTFGADLGYGTGATNSCISAVRAASEQGCSGEVVLEYADPNIKPEQAATLAVALCRLFGNAELAWEVPGPGLVFTKKVLELNYHRVYYRYSHPTIDKGERAKEPGWTATNKTKPVLHKEYEQALASGELMNRSLPSLDECLYFRYKTNGDIEHSGEASAEDPSGARVAHGDRVVSVGLAWMLAKPEVQAASQKEKEAEKVPLLSLAWRRKHAANQKPVDSWAG